MNGFQEKDLVLFLPTRIDRPNGENIPSNDKIQPWLLSILEHHIIFEN